MDVHLPLHTGSGAYLGSGAYSGKGFCSGGDAYSGFGLGAIMPLMYVHMLVPGFEPFPFQVEAQHTPHSLSLANKHDNMNNGIHYE